MTSSRAAVRDPADARRASAERLDDVLVGIPAYEEEVGIGSVVLAARRLTDDVLVVDDGSADETASIAEAAGATVVRHETNRGKGAAIRTIFNRARVEDFEAVVVLDGDGQHDPADIPDVVAPVLDHRSDLVIGSRYLEGTADETPLYRRFGQRVLDVLTAAPTDASLTDTQSGFRALSVDAIEELSIETDGMGVESEMIGAASDADLHIEEVPIDVTYENVDGQTYNPLQHGLSVLAFVLRLVHDRHPLLFYGVPGLAALGAASLLGLDALVAVEGSDPVSPAAVVATGLLVLVGVLCLFSALVLTRVRSVVGDAA